MEGIGGSVKGVVIAGLFSGCSLYRIRGWQCSVCSVQQVVAQGTYLASHFKSRSLSRKLVISTFLRHYHEETVIPRAVRYDILFYRCY